MSMQPPDWREWSWMAQDTRWTRALQWIRRHLPGGQRLVNWLCEREIAHYEQMREDFYITQVLSACWQTGKVVRGEIDEDGHLEVTVQEDTP